mmetsp:Transcript_5252/g.12314  ORF Transcript_5252/g.12314 Transcript_5252/m.12314 type:complete len:232 (+) Transcript_5252:1035-1730(+)
MNQLANSTNSFSWRARDTNRVDIKVALAAHSQHSSQSTEDDSVRVLEEDDPLSPFFLPLLHEPMLMEKGVDVPMSVRLRLDLAGRGGKSCLDVHEGGNLILLDDDDLIAVHTEVLVLFQQLYSERMGIITRHDSKREFSSISMSSLQSKDVADVKVQKASFSFDNVQRKRDLDPFVSQSLSESPGNKHKSCIFDRLGADRLHLQENLRSHLKLLSGRDLRLKARERIDSFR